MTNIENATAETVEEVSTPAVEASENENENGLTVDSFVNKSEALKLTGFTAAKFSDKATQALAELGADFSAPQPKGWKIPVAALIAIGWLNDDLSQTESARKTRKTSTGTKTTRPAAPRKSSLEKLQDTIVKADHEIEALTEKLNAAKAAKKEAEKGLNAAKREDLNRLKAEAAALRKQGEDALAAAAEAEAALEALAAE